MIKDIAPMGLRMPPELKAQIRKVAKENGRSMNSEILARLASSFDPRVDLSRVPTSELVRELLDRNEPGKIFIEIKGPLARAAK
jgi:hypothetical protein